MKLRDDWFFDVGGEKDPYVLEFLNVPENLTGKETLLETALLGNLQQFLLELGLTRKSPAKSVASALKSLHLRFRLAMRLSFSHTLY